MQFPLQGVLQKDSNTHGNIKDILDASYYLKDFSQAREYGPVNKIQITTTGIEDATTKEDTASIGTNGIQTVTINDNYFLGTIEAREYAIKGLWNALYNMRYTPISTTYLGFPYLEMGDFINVVLPDGTTVESFVFNYTFTYDGGYMGTLETPTISRTQETYPTNTIDDKVSRIGVNVDRANAEISAIVEDVSGVQAELSLKLDRDDNDQIVSMINASADYVTIDSKKLNINGVISANGNFEVDTEGNMTCNDATIDDATMHSVRIRGGDIQLTGGTLDNPNFLVMNDSNQTESIVFPRLHFRSRCFRRYSN